MTNLHDGSSPFYQPPGLPDPVTVDTVLQDFARALTRLNDTQLRMGLAALALQDPRDVLNHLAGLTASARMLGRADATTDELVNTIGAQCVAYRLARARVDELDITTGDAA